MWPRCCPDAGSAASGVHSDTSGLTLTPGPAAWSRHDRDGVRPVTSGPALFGLGAAWLLHRGHAVGVLWAALVLLALLLLQIRNLYGLWAVLVAGGAVFVVSWTASAAVQAAVAYAGTWFLLVAAPRAVLELQRERVPAPGTRLGRRHPGPRHAAARRLAWVGVFLLVTLGCLALGARWMVAGAR